MLYVEECLEVLSMECPTWKKEQDDAMRKSDAFCFPPFSLFLSPKDRKRKREERREAVHMILLLFTA